MNKKRVKTEEIVNKLREADVLLSKGQTVAQAGKQIGVTGFTYYCWRREYGGTKTNQAQRLKELERENGRLKRLHCTDDTAHQGSRVFFTTKAGK